MFTTPSINYLGFDKKVRFKVSPEDFEKEVEETHLEHDDIDLREGGLDADAFWKNIANHLIFEAIADKKIENPFNVKPSLRNWAPWLSVKSRKSKYLVNTEYDKLNKKSETFMEENLGRLTEGLIEDLDRSASLNIIRQICLDCGIKASTLNRGQCLTQLKSALVSHTKLDKLLKKISGHSGGMLIASCQHGIVYGIKWLLRCESPRDHVDLLLCFKHLPSIIISDMPHIIVAHAHKRKPNMFKPHLGRVLEASELNLELAEAGELSVSLPWLTQGKFRAVHPSAMDTEEHNYSEVVHPVTGTTSNLSLYDKFHEGNTKKREEILRRVGHIPELNGIISTQKVEQITSWMAKNIYFFDMMRPLHHLVISRSMILYKNAEINLARLKHAKLEFKGTPTYDHIGRINFSSFFPRSDQSSVNEIHTNVREDNITSEKKENEKRWSMLLNLDHSIM